MLELVYINNAAFVFNINDWEELRKQHRIVGDLFGKTQFVPTLPIRLNPEEVYLLINKGIAKLVKYDKLSQAPIQQDKEVLVKFEEELLNEETKIYRDARKEELEQTINKIVAGKRKKGDDRPKADILEAELEKSSSVTKEQMIWPVFTEHLSEMRGIPTTISMESILQWTSIKKCKIFTDLWEKGYYVTPGQKFGGDFLAYLGDPLNFHAIHIVRCVEDANESMHPSEIIAFGRLGTSVKKNAVLASVNEDDTISYITINWMDS